LTVGCDVYANSNAIACKAGDAKVIASFPDVCLSPPSPPAGPVPVPYPNTSFDKDMQNGSKTVMIKGQEVMLKDQSFYKTSPLGDEAATNSFGGSVVTHVITGKTYFQAWSMDVQFEGQNVDRNLDLTGSNCASPPSDMLGNVSEKKESTEAQKPKCECCDNAPHSAAQARGESITEEEFYGPKQTGLRKRSVKKSVDPSGFIMAPNPLSKAEEARVTAAQLLLAETRAGKCPDQVPNNPPKGPCDKYYRSTAEETQKAREDFDDFKNINNPDRPSEVFDKPGAKMVSHRVPLAGGGCPVGPGNLTVITTQECKDHDNKLGKAQEDVANIARDKA
jgi:hypothetical protein